VALLLLREDLQPSDPVGRQVISVAKRVTDVAVLENVVSTLEEQIGILREAGGVAVLREGAARTVPSLVLTRT
jgi:hypothetical protein